LRTIIKFLGIFLTIFIILFGLWAISEKLRFNAIVIHHSASAVDNYQSIAEFHKNQRGWRDAAYHLILSNGSTEIPLGFLEATSRYRYLSPSVATKNRYYNLRAIHICVVGDYDKQEMPAGLKAALADALRQLQKKYWFADDQILFHRDCSTSACPGRFITKGNVKQWLITETSRCPVPIKIQHEKVLGRDWKLLSLTGRAVGRFGDHAFGLLKFLLPGPLPLA
jgi:hypothetical protein